MRKAHTSVRRWVLPTFLVIPFCFPTSFERHTTYWWEEPRLLSQDFPSRAVLKRGSYWRHRSRTEMLLEKECLMSELVAYADSADVRKKGNRNESLNSTEASFWLCGDRESQSAVFCLMQFINRAVVWSWKPFSDPSQKPPSGILGFECLNSHPVLSVLEPWRLIQIRIEPGSLARDASILYVPDGSPAAEPAADKQRHFGRTCAIYK